MTDTPDPSPDLTLDIDSETGIATITIANRSRLNAMTASMWAALPSRVAEADRRPDVRVIVLRGAGLQSFCAGADISEFDAQRSGDAVHTYDGLNHAAFDALTNCSKPTIAMIYGFCMGGGLGLALACDLRICDHAAQFAIPAAKLGIGYNRRWMTPILRAVSPATAKLILFTGRRFSSSEAVAMGLVARASGTEELEAAAHDLAREIASNAPLSIAASKAAINDLSSADHKIDGARLDRLAQACFESEDYKEGRAAFREKRKPVFHGR